MDLEPAIRKAFDGEVKAIPLLPAASPEWRQSGWAVSADWSVRPVPSLTTYRLFSIWTKVVQQRQNGWDGESFYVSVIFDEKQSAAAVARYMLESVSADIDRRREAKLAELQNKE